MEVNLKVVKPQDVVNVGETENIVLPSHLRQVQIHVIPMVYSNEHLPIIKVQQHEVLRMKPLKKTF